LRRADQADAEFIAATFTSSRRVAMPYLSQLYTELQVLEWIEDVILRNSLVTLAVDDGRNVGGFASVRAAFSSTFTLHRVYRGKDWARTCSRRPRKKARAVYACMSSNEIYPLADSTSNADSSWLNCATVRQMKKASLTLSMSG